MPQKHWVQYHTPARMGYGIDEAENRFSIVTSKDCGIHNPVGDIAWLVGRKDEEDASVYLGGWFVIQSIEASPNPEFLYQFVGQVGGSCKQFPKISEEKWFSRLLKLTTSFRRGLTEVPRGAVLAGLRKVAEEAGCPQID